MKNDVFWMLRHVARATQRNIAEDGILHSHRRVNFKSYRIEIFHREILRGHSKFHVIMRHLSATACNIEENDDLM
jgi:hypothetical protein